MNAEEERLKELGRQIVKICSSYNKNSAERLKVIKEELIDLKTSGSTTDVRIKARAVLSFLDIIL